MANLINAISKLLLEEIAPGSADSLPKLDDFWKDVHTTWMGVTQDGIGRDWKVLHTFREGLSGAVRWVAAGGEDTYSTQPTHSIVPGTPREFPGLDESVLPGHFQKTITLSELLGNVFLPDEYLRADRLTASIASSVDEIVESHKKLQMLAEIVPFMSPATVPTGGQAVPGYLATVANNPSAPSTSSTGALIIKGGSVQLFYIGMGVDVFNSAYSTKRNTVDLLVDQVTYVPSASDTAGYGQVVLKTRDGSVAPDLAANDVIVLKDSVVEHATPASVVTYGPASPDSWLIATGSAFGINVGTYTQLQSIVATSLNQALDGDLLTKLFSRFSRAYGMLDVPDTLVMSQGVKNSFVNNSPFIGSVMVTRSVNDRYVPHEGYDFDDTPFSFNGRPVKFRTSSYFYSETDYTAQSTSYGGRIWGLKTREKNIVRYIPPRQAGTKTGMGMGNEVEFRFGLEGPNGLFWPVTSSTGRLTQWSQAPWTKRVAYCPKVMQGIKATGLAESL